ncbi:MAG: hypothetical protein R2882_01740 [Gemmatimonadales bacterium]
MIDPARYLDLAADRIRRVDFGTNGKLRLGRRGDEPLDRRPRDQAVIGVVEDGGGLDMVQRLTRVRPMEYKLKRRRSATPTTRNAAEAIQHTVQPSSPLNVPLRSVGRAEARDDGAPEGTPASPALASW